MAQVKKKGKRTRKHRGNAAGIVERPTSGTTKQRRPKSKDEIRAESRQRRVDRMNRPPTWKGAAQRAGIAAAMFAVLVVVVLRDPPAKAAGFAVFMLILYIPLSYMTDRALYNWRQKRKPADRG